MSAEAVAVSATSDAPRLKGRTTAHFNMSEVRAPFLYGGVLARLPDSGRRSFEILLL